MSSTANAISSLFKPARYEQRWWNWALSRAQETGLVLSKNEGTAQAQLGCLIQGEIARQATEKAIAEPDEAVLAAAASRQYHHDLEAVKALNAGSKYAECVFQSPSVDAYDCIRFALNTYLAGFNRSPKSTKCNMVLLGGTGAGKTVAALATAARLMQYLDSKPCWNGRFIKARAMSDATGHGAEVKKLREDLMNITVLVIDDLPFNPVDNVTQPFASLVYDLIDERYRHRRPTIITTNATVTDLKATYSERVIDRWHESAHVFESEQSSLRRLSQ
jgi:DNA replication protein DnaC